MTPGSKRKVNEISNARATQCNRCCLEKAATLIEEGAQIDMADSRGYTPLCLAAATGNVEMVKLLAFHGANVNHKINRGFSPLFLAATRLKRETVFALREFEADVTFNELSRAVSRKDVMELLRECGANLSAKDNRGRTLLHWAAWEGKADIADWLLTNTGVDIDDLDEDYWTPLHYAVRDGHVTVAKLLLDKGACTNIRDRWGDTPLSVAQFWEHTALCKTLLRNGEDTTHPVAKA